MLACTFCLVFVASCASCITHCLLVRNHRARFHEAWEHGQWLCRMWWVGGVTLLANMSIDLNFVELKAGVLDFFSWNIMCRTQTHVEKQTWRRWDRKALPRFPDINYESYAYSPTVNCPFRCTTANVFRGQQVNSLTHVWVSLKRHIHVMPCHVEISL